MDTPEALATLEHVLGADVDVVDRDELAELVRASSRLRAVLDGFDVRCSRRARELCEAGQAESPSSMLGRNGNRSRKQARSVARREHAATQLPDFEDALGAGEVSAEHLDVIADVATGLSDEVRLVFNDHQAELLDAARNDSVEAFTRRCRTLIRRIRAQLGGPGESDAAELDRQRAASTVKRWTDKVTGMCHTHVELDPVRNAEMWSAIDAHIARIRSTDGNRHLTWNQLQVQAVVDATSAGVTTHDNTDTATQPGYASHVPQRTALAPQPAQRVPEITVLVGLDVLQSGAAALDTSVTGICETLDGHPLPIATVRRMCCDAEILPAILDGDGEVTDLGRSRRTANRAQRRQLAAMHRTCAHPHCTVGFSACRIHHIRWSWRDHGHTDITNLLPLCERHHHLVHEGGWTLTLHSGRIATWTRPDGTTWHTGPTIDRPVTDRFAPGGSHMPGHHPVRTT